MFVPIHLLQMRQAGVQSVLRSVCLFVWHAKSVGFFSTYRLSGVVVERPPRVLYVHRSIPGRVIPNIFITVVMAAFFGVYGCGVSIMTDWLVSE